MMLVFGLLPIANWIPGGHEAPWYRSRLDEWITGTGIVFGVATVFTILAKRVRVETSTVLRPMQEYAARHASRTGWTISAVALVTYLGVAQWVFSGVPLHLDELAQVIQARIFAQGRLYLDAPAYPEFTSLLHVLDSGGKWYTQFPPGGPALLLPGVWLGAAWLSGPVTGALGVRVFWSIVTRTEGRIGVALSATLLFAFAPFVLFMSGSHMNHVSALLFALVSAWAWLCHHQSGATRYAAVGGLALGVLASIRPVDALACALPAATWLLWRVYARRDRAAFFGLIAAALGVLGPLLMLGAYNAATTGSPFQFAYEVLWGEEHGLGFHAAPWGFAHTPVRGMELVSLYFLRLQTYLFESPVPGLLFPALGLLLFRKWSFVDRLWLVSGALMILLYGLYWHDGFYLGPRFFYLLVPALALWTARMPGSLSKLIGRRRPEWIRLPAVIVVVTLAMAVLINIPLRVGQYQRGLAPMRNDATRLAARQQVTGGIILVRESWGAQILARLWSLGVSRSEAEALYRSVDTCALDEAVSRAEHGRRPTSWRALLADSAVLVPSTLSPDETQRVLPGRPYSPRCLQRIAEDRAGFTILAPLLAKEWGGNVYARDLHQRNAVLLRDYPDRPVYLLRSAGFEPGAPLELVPLSRDSLVAAWASEDP